MHALLSTAPCFWEFDGARFAAAQDILFVDGLTTTVDFHIDMQLKLEWPASRKYLHTFDFTNPATLASKSKPNYT